MEIVIIDYGIKLVWCGEPRYKKNINLYYSGFYSYQYCIF